MKKILFILLLLVLIVGCTQAPTMDKDIEKKDKTMDKDMDATVDKDMKDEPMDDTKDMKDEPMDDTMDETAGETAVETMEEPKVVELYMIARNWAFVPDEITVKKGDMVKLNINVESGDHGFALPEFGINEELLEGSIVVIEFTADVEGEFGFFCSKPCGSGHSGMTGKLIVE